MTLRIVRLIAAAAPAAAALAVGVLTVGPVTPAAAATTHVGIVVRFANGSSQTACTTSGGTGLAVLKRKFSVLVGQAPPYAGFVFTINNQGTTHPDNSHYWSYWHSTGKGTWTYSSAGAGSYTPKAGTVEGWSYVNGNSTAPEPPASTYATLCASSDPVPKAPKPAPSSTHPAKASTHPATSTAAHQSSHPTAAGSTTRSTTPNPAGALPASTSDAAAARSTTRPATTPPASTTTPSTTGAAGTSAASSGSADASPVAGTIRAAEPPSHKGAAGFPAWGTALALLVVAALGVTAWLRSRQRRA